MTPNNLKFAAAVLGRIPSEQRASAMASIRAQNPDAAKRIEENLFAFENLADLDGRSLQRLLREVNANSLTMALRGLDKGILEKFCAGMSRRAAEDLKENLESGEKVRLADVEAERKRILKLAHMMAERGEIVFSRADDPLVE
jgi:flagellar motor switch protein FliG